MKSSPSSPFIYFLLNWILQLYAFDSAFVQIKLFAFNFIHLKIKMSFKKLFLHSNPKQRFVSMSFLFFTWLWWTIYIYLCYMGPFTNYVNAFLTPPSPLWTGHEHFEYPLVKLHELFQWTLLLCYIFLTFFPKNVITSFRNFTSYVFGVHSFY